MPQCVITFITGIVGTGIAGMPTPDDATEKPLAAAAPRGGVGAGCTEGETRPPDMSDATLLPDAAPPTTGEARPLLVTVPRAVAGAPDGKPAGLT